MADTGETASLIARLPKVELHCHLDGIVDVAMLRALRARGVDLPLTPEALAAASPVRDFESFVWWFAAQRPLAGALDCYRPIIAIHVERLRAQRVVYAEVMVASGELSLDPAAAVDQMAAFRAWVDEQPAVRDGAVQVELLVAFGRNRPPERVAQIATRNLRLRRAGLIAGVALAGPEDGYPVEPLAATFARYREAGVRIEIHAGEWCGPESVWDALDHGRPDRIGHGTHAFADPRLVAALLARGTHVEMCPTSNLRTGSIPRIEDHPIRRALDAGLNVGVNTDDPGAFGSSMRSEYALLAGTFGCAENDLRRLAANALRSRFQSALRGAALDAARELGVSPFSNLLETPRATQTASHRNAGA